MIIIKGYKEMDEHVFQRMLKRAYEMSGKTHFKIATDINVSSTQTPANALKVGKQIVSDEVLTKVMDSIGVEGFIQWHKGTKYYYVKNGK